MVLVLHGRLFISMAGMSYYIHIVKGVVAHETTPLGGS